MPIATAPIEIRSFDPHAATRAEWAPYHAYRRQRAAEEFPDLPLLGDADFEREAQRQFPSSCTIASSPRGAASWWAT